jgi:UDP-N-acetylmuramoylalanine--D-glutamate ligase
MDRYNSFGDYVAAKQRIYDGCEIAVWNQDDEVTRPQSPVPAQMTFGVHPQSDYRLDIQRGMLMRRGEDLLPVSALKVRGNHNVLNVLAVLAMAEALGLEQQACLRAVQEFVGLPHRCVLVAEQAGVQWFNDSKGTNVGATLAALTGIGPAIAGKVVLIAGGQGKQQDFSPLGSVAAEYVRAAVLIGEDAEQLAAVLTDVPCHFASDMAAAVRQAEQLAQTGDAVLLSPACASFDMFRGYADRGDTFIRCVTEVLHEV